MLNSQRRISQSSFPQILKEGRSFFTPNLSLRVSPKKERGFSAFSFVISAKAVKTAVERNLLKRRGRHVIKKHLKLIKDGYFCAFFFKKDLLRFPFSAFEQEFLFVLKKANLLK